MSKYQIIWFPILQNYIQFMKEDHTEYWFRKVDCCGTRNIDLVPAHIIGLLILNMIIPFKIIKGGKPQ